MSSQIDQSLQSASPAELEERGFHEDFLERVNIRFARRHGVIAFLEDDGVVLFAHKRDTDSDVLDSLGRFLKSPYRELLLDPEHIDHLINSAYEGRSAETEEYIATLDRDEVLEEIDALAVHEDLLESAGRAPVIRLVNMILFEAIKTGASDVHIQPYETDVVVRMRLDGVLFDLFHIPLALKDEIASRVKVLAEMNIAEKRLAQDGRATVELGDRLIDLRISSVPTSYGERIVIRLLDKSARLYTLEELGMEKETLTQFTELIGTEHGILLVTGPTGSGKSTTLYAALQAINSTARNILTLEDPIEFSLKGISQIQVSTKKGMTFASGLRSVLRQDPDIIMVGEIRDHETAVMAIQSALTGHLVFSTLHTNDAPSAVTRLLDLGVEPYLVASSVIGVLAQRLVRRLCRDCKEPYTPSPREAERIGLAPGKRLWTNGRCEACRETGYRGRMGLFELLQVTDGVRRLVTSSASASEVHELAEEQGMKTLLADGRRRLALGDTSIDEILRVTARRSD